MSNYVEMHIEKINSLTEIILGKCGELYITGILIHGSAVNLIEPRDLDILLIITKEMTSKEKRELRGILAREIRREIDFDLDIEIRVHTLKYFSVLKPLHFGLAGGYMIIHDPSRIISKIMIKVDEVSTEWNTKKVETEDGSWIILPKGKAFLNEPLEYSISLIEEK